jgi:hypothetical protein
VAGRTSTAAGAGSGADVGPGVGTIGVEFDGAVNDPSGVAAGPGARVGVAGGSGVADIFGADADVGAGAGAGGGVDIEVVDVATGVDPAGVIKSRISS